MNLQERLRRLEKLGKEADDRFANYDMAARMRSLDLLYDQLQSKGVQPEDTEMDPTHKALLDDLYDQLLARMGGECRNN